MESISVSILNGLISEGKSQVLLDVREPWEFAQCRIPGSINIPITEVSNKLGDIDRDKDIIVICHHGARSWQVANFLENSGFINKIKNLDGGINAWAELIDTEMPRY